MKFVPKDQFQEMAVRSKKVHERVIKNGEVVKLSHSQPFILLKVEDGAEVTIMDDYDLSSGEPMRDVLVEIGKDAKVKWNGYQHHGDDVNSGERKKFILSDGARLDLYQNILGGFKSSDEVTVELEGRGSEVFSQTVFFGHGNQEQEMRVNHVHIGENTTSNMISKGAVKGRSHGKFLGYIRMEPGCSGADGNLEEHNLLLSSGAKIDAVPGLEIGHHDVAASHAAYMERVDDERLFYLASRGIPEEEAISLIIEGFFLDAIQKMGDEALEARVFGQILNHLTS